MLVVAVVLMIIGTFIYLTLMSDKPKQTEFSEEMLALREAYFQAKREREREKGNEEQ